MTAWISSSARCALEEPTPAVTPWRCSSVVPAFLANDILRIWRTFCVNYEARTETEPAEKKAKRKLKNYKLEHSRLLTCYSALLRVFKDRTPMRSIAANECLLPLCYQTTAK
jgi:hypothetical protein